jgi:hypothetical protein
MRADNLARVLLFIAGVSFALSTAGANMVFLTGPDRPLSWLFGCAGGLALGLAASQWKGLK